MTSSRRVATKARITRVFIGGQEIPQNDPYGDRMLNGDPVPTITLSPPPKPPTKSTRD